MVAIRRNDQSPYRGGAFIQPAGHIRHDRQRGPYNIRVTGRSGRTYTVRVYAAASGSSQHNLDFVTPGALI